MSRGPRKYDPKEVEHEYVAGEISLRALAAVHKVSFSSLAAYARKQDWAGKKIAYRAALSRHTYEIMASEQGNQRAVIADESVKLMRATLSVFAEQLATRKIQISPKDAMEAIRTLAELLRDPEGGAGDGRDARIINGTSRTIDTDLLRRIADAARGQIAPDGVLAGIAPGEPSGTRPN